MSELDAIPRPCDADSALIADRQALALAHQGLVTWVAKKYRDRGLALEDLIQAGQLGLMNACHSYDPDRAGKDGTLATFPTYAQVAIRRAIRRAILDQKGVARVPQPLHVLRARIRQGEVDHGRLPATTRTRLDAAERILAGTCTDQAVLARTLADERPSPGDETPGSTLIRSILDSLAGWERAVIVAYYGFDGDGGESHAAIAERVGIPSAKQAAAIHGRALFRLQRRMGRFGPHDEAGR